jgi:hypothetical protein
MGTPGDYYEANVRSLAADRSVRALRSSSGSITSIASWVSQNPASHLSMASGPQPAFACNHPLTAWAAATWSGGRTFLSISDPAPVWELVERLKRHVSALFWFDYVFPPVPHPSTKRQVGQRPGNGPGKTRHLGD